MYQKIGEWLEATFGPTEEFYTSRGERVVKTTAGLWLLRK